jgi:CBS domain-containing protein
MLVEAIMHREVAVVERDHTALRVARIMKEKRSGVAVVVDERKRPIGIITDRDLVTRLLSDSLDPEKVCVDQIMSTPVHAVDGDALVFDCLRAMAKHKVHRMPVIDQEARIVGIVHVADALMLLTTELANISEVVGRRRHA